MKKLIISGSSKLYERALYWRGYFEGRGYEVIDYPTPLTDDPDLESTTPVPGFFRGNLLTPEDKNFAERMSSEYHRFWKHLDDADVLFFMNEDKDGIEGYIGYGGMAEIGYAVISNFNRNRELVIYLLKAPNPAQGCYEELKFWLDQGWIKLYRPTRRLSAPLPIPAAEPAAPAPTAQPAVAAPTQKAPTPSVAPAPETTEKKSGLFSSRDDRELNLVSCKKKCLRPLTPTMREYLSIFNPDIPAWLLRYIAAPEFQRLKGVSMTTMDYGSTYTFANFNSVFTHSIGTALIVWHFTKDKRQTIATLLHDIASPSFKHAIDYLNGDSERQESIEKDTGAIIRKSKAIMRQLKKDGIMPSEIDDYHLYPLADNETPGLAADRLEYTFSNGYFLFDTWNLEDVRRFYSNITVLKNEASLDELSFADPALAAEFTERNLALAANYSNPASRATLQFIADILSSMFISNQLALDDLYALSEREVIDWILSCGDHTISDAFRNFQRATEVYSGSAARKGSYNTAVRAKVRYIVPLAATDECDVEGQPLAYRITELDQHAATAVKKYLADKQAKYVGFDFDFKPYSPKDDK